MFDVFSVADLINMVLLCVTTGGVFAAFRQLKASAKAQRATFLKDLYMQLRTDDAVAEAFYLIEYSEFEYDRNFHGSSLERKVDRLLTLIDLVCEMHDQKIISKREMEFFEYQFSRVASDSAVREYLEFLDGFYQRVGIERSAFPAFQRFSRSRQK